MEIMKQPLIIQKLKLNNLLLYYSFNANNKRMVAINKFVISTLIRFILVFLDLNILFLSYKINNNILNDCININCNIGFLYNIINVAV